MNAPILTLNQQEVLDPEKSGKKGSALALLYKRGFRVPEFFVITPGAFINNLSNRQRRHWQELLPVANNADDRTDEIQNILSDIDLNDDFVQQLKSAAIKLSRAKARSFAVRSSGVEEDGSSHSFAGQFDTFINIGIEQLSQKIIEVWRSAYSARVIAYRRERQLPWFCGMPAILIQVMVDAEISGVAFSADPVSNDRDICVVEAVYGLGHGLVSGELEADLFRIARDGSLVECVIQNKSLAYRCKTGPDSAGQSEGETIEATSVTEAEARQSTLTDFQYNAVSQLARKCENMFGAPQDIEWSIEKGRLYLLQSRPISTFRNPEMSVEGAVAGCSQTGFAKPSVTLWDNSNISESYNGVTTPLTFTFARKAYEHVYLQFCRLMRVPQYKIDANVAVFPCMIGLLQGRVYYNLLNWYRLLSLLPGYSVNRRFMEQMMGVKEGVPDELLAAHNAPSFVEKLKDLFCLILTVIGLAYRYCRLNNDIDGFYDRLSQALDEDLKQEKTGRSHLCEVATASSGKRSAREASRAAVHNAQRYKKLEEKLLVRWDAPLVNDFFAMIFYGLLSSLCRKWCGDKAGTLHNALVGQQGGLISAEPARRICSLAALCAGDPAFISVLSAGDVAAAEAMIRTKTAFEKEYRSYLAKFGDRCLEELKLESKTLADDPSLLLRSIAQAALRQETLSVEARQKAGSQTTKAESWRCQAENIVAERLSASPFKKVIFFWVLKNARARVRDRENLRFERTRLFGRVRRIFLEIGSNLCKAGILQDSRDIFYLQLEEIFSFINGSATCTNLKGLVELRRREFAAYKQMPESPTRIQTEDLVYPSLQFVSKRDYTADSQAPACEIPVARHGAVQTGACAVQTKLSTGITYSGQATENSLLRGTGCCPGIVRGRVRVVLDPQSAFIEQGEILVAKRTDPGWIMLFPSASALIVEHGSLLSHSAIVARELGLPAVISVSSATSLLCTGDYVELDGATGLIKVVARSSNDAAKLSATCSAACLYV